MGLYRRCTLDATLDCFLISPSLSDPRLLSHFLVKEVASFLSKSLPSSSSKKTQIHSCKQLDGKIFMGSLPVRIIYFFWTSPQSHCSLQGSDENKTKNTNMQIPLFFLLSPQDARLQSPEFDFLMRHARIVNTALAQNIANWSCHSSLEGHAGFQGL